MKVALGSLVAEINGVTFSLDALESMLPAFVCPGDTPADFTVELSHGDRRVLPGVSRPISEEVDHRARRVTVRLSEWTATFDLGARHVRVHLGGPWVSALESLLKTAMQIFALEIRSALFLHACSVARGGSGYIFMGRSGAGKSTTGLLSADAGIATLLREEITCIGGLGAAGELAVSTLPLREKNRRSLGHPVSFPLRAVYWLVQATEDTVETPAFDEQVRLLAAATTIGVRDKIFMLPALELAGEVVRRVPVKVLRFRKSTDFWAAIDADLEG